MYGQLSLDQLAADFATALKRVDADQIGHKQFLAGVGPYGEADAVRAALSKLRADKPVIYNDAVIKRLPDLLIPERWAVEFKIARPFGDNGRAAEHWSENLLHPYAGNTSSLGDCLKLLSSGIRERKAVVIIGYEHTPPRVSLDAAIRGFEILAEEVMGLILTSRIEHIRDSLVHPVHQQLRVFAYEVLDGGRFPSRDKKWSRENGPAQSPIGSPIGLMIILTFMIQRTGSYDVSSPSLPPGKSRRDNLAGFCMLTARYE